MADGFIRSDNKYTSITRFMFNNCHITTQLQINERFKYIKFKFNKF